MNGWTCTYDGTRVAAGKQCRSCELYNAAVAAQQAAAQILASGRHERAERAWLNEHGVFAFVDGVAMQVGSKQEAALFAALTTAARALRAMEVPDGEG